MKITRLWKIDFDESSSLRNQVAQVVREFNETRTDQRPEKVFVSEIGIGQAFGEMLEAEGLPISRMRRPY